MAKHSKVRQDVRLRQMLYWHPMLFWSVLLSVLVVLSSIAWYLMSSPNFIAANSRKDGSLPLWSYGAIAFFCAFGCLAIARWLDREN